METFWQYIIINLKQKIDEKQILQKWKLENDQNSRKLIIDWNPNQIC